MFVKMLTMTRKTSAIEMKGRISPNRLRRAWPHTSSADRLKRMEGRRKKLKERRIK